MYKKFTLLLSNLALLIAFLSIGKVQAQQTFSLGDYDTTTEHFQGSIGQKAPFDFDYKYSRSQQLYTTEDLNGLEGKEITEIRMRVYNQDGMIYVDDYSVNLRLYLTNTEITEFKKKEGENKYRWHDIDKEKDLCATMTFSGSFMDELSEDFEIVIKLDKPFLYTGKSMLMTMEAEANQALGEVSQTYIDFYCYPKNVSGKPITTIYKADDSKNVATPEGYGEYSNGSGLKQRAVLKISYRTPEPTPIDDPLDPVNPVITVKEAGKIENQLKTITNLAACESLTVIGSITPTDIAFIQSNMGGLKKLDMQQATIEGNALPKTAFSKHPNLAEVILPSNLTLIDDAALSDMPKLTRVVMGNEVTTIGMNAFALSRSLQDIVLSDKLIKISSDAFKECKALKNIDIPNSVTIIEQNAFTESGLVAFKAPERLQTIERMCFLNCADLKEIYLPASITELKIQALGNCKSLTKVTSLNVTPPTLHAKTFDKVKLATVELYVATDEAVTAYKAANWWKNFGNIKRMGEVVKEFYKLTYKSAYEEGTVKAYRGEEELPTEASIEEGTTIRFVATPKEEVYLLKKWKINNKEVLATSAEYAMEIKEETTVEAIFEEAYTRHRVSFQANNAEWGRVSATIGGNEIESSSLQKADQTVTFTAHPAPNYHLKHWLVNGKETPKQGESTLEVVLNKQTLVEAVFERDIIYYQLSISISDNNGGVYATVGGGRIPLSSRQKEGTEVEITAEPEDNYTFDFWTINGKKSEQTEPTLQITMDTNYRIVANFKKIVSNEQIATERSVQCTVAQGILQVSYGVEGASVHLFDTNGLLIEKSAIHAGQAVFNLHEGIYLVHVEGSEEAVKVSVRR